ncbi:MAG: PEGA domain-containing protein [Thermoanaerobaculia bacterium]
MTRIVRQTIGAAVSLMLVFPATLLRASHGGGSHGGGSHGGGSHGTSHSGGSHGSHSGGSHSHGSHHDGSDHGGPHTRGSRGTAHDHGRSGGEWIFFGAPFWGGFGGWLDNPVAEPLPEADETADSAETARLTFSVEPDDAVVYLDGHLLGTGDEVGRTLRGVPVDPGSHTLDVQRPGYRAWSSDIELAPAETRNVEVSLDRE